MSINDRILQAMAEETAERQNGGVTGGPHPYGGGVAIGEIVSDPGERLISDVSRSVNEVHDHVLNSIASLEATLDLIKRAIQAKRKAHEERLRDYVGFSKEAIEALAKVDEKVRELGAEIMDMPTPRTVETIPDKPPVGQ